MKFQAGDIVKLKDDGETNFAIVQTRENDKNSVVQKGFDYAVKRLFGSNKNGVYLRQVFEENLYIA